jgi:host factor-I protein
MSPNTPRRQPKAASTLMTGQESLYLRFLSEKQVTVNVKLRDGEVVSGWIEYYDEGMIRLTREGKPNLFIYKQQIRTISELARKDEGRRRVALRKESAEAERAAQPHSSLQPSAQMESAR